MVFDKLKIFSPFTMDARNERFLFWKEDTFTDPFPHNLALRKLGRRDR
jgi:hypothetical protein